MKIKRKEVQRLIDLAYDTGVLVGYRDAAEKIFAADLDHFDEVDKQISAEAGLELAEADKRAQKYARKLHRRGWLPSSISHRAD